MRETRSFRADVRLDDTNKLSAYAAKYGILSDDLGGFFETILPGAFAEAVADDVTCNIEHDDLRLLGRTPDELTLTDDDHGLFFSVTVPDTEDGKYIRYHVGKQNLRHCSFAFDTLDESWDKTDDGKPLRQIRKVKLYDVSIVVRPAYMFDTQIALRSLDQWRAQSGKPHLRRAKRMLEVIRKFNRSHK